jgi:hypothetical protein
MNTILDTLQVNGVEYVRRDSVGTVAPSGGRCVVVVDRGWIFAGDLTEENGRIRLANAVWVFKWDSVGFDGVLKNPKSGSVTLKKMQHIVDLPKESEIFRVPVDSNWGK